MEKKFDTIKMAENLVKLRGSRTQKQVADAIGIPVSTYGMYEIGKRIPCDDIKIKIADYHHRTVQFIFFN